ncbi:MAG: capsid cement protein [Gemmatimonadales bacterium]
MNPILTKNFNAAAAISQYRIVKFGAADGDVQQAAAATDAQVGVANLDAALNERVDVVVCGIAEVRLGGTVTRGNLITSDANGKGVAASAAIGANQRYLGIAMVSGVAEDIIDVLIAPGEYQGA